MEQHKGLLEQLKECTTVDYSPKEFTWENIAKWMQDMHEHYERNQATRKIEIDPVYLMSTPDEVFKAIYLSDRYKTMSGAKVIALIQERARNLKLIPSVSM